jgi:hypothetical protein
VAKRKERTVRVRPETRPHPIEATSGATPQAPRRGASLTPAILWGAAAALAVFLAVALFTAVGPSGFSGGSRWGFIGCLFVLGMALLMCGAKAAEAFMNWKEPGWQPPPRKDD